MNRTANICERLADVAREECGRHPFASIMNQAQLEAVLPDYLAMSLAFRYLQAAAQKDAIFDAIRRNRDVPEEIELTNAVGNFLAWDESGGNELMLTHGKSGLPNVLDTSHWFHSNILRADASKILGHPISPNFSPTTRRYLGALYRGLASTDVVRRCASMVAFEVHAGVMIASLWGTITAVSALPRNELRYFHLHMGGNDASEKYHVELTMRLIERVVPSREHERFLSEFRHAFQLSFEWCHTLMQPPLASRASEVKGKVWHRGACHCGGVEFEVRAPAVLEAMRCNCSICEKSGFLHLLVPAESFRLISGGDLLTNYEFNLRIAKHTFCRVCGIKPFYRPRSNPGGFSVNVRCLDRSTVSSVEVSDFDGQHWEESIHELGN